MTQKPDETKKQMINKFNSKMREEIEEGKEHGLLFLEFSLDKGGDPQVKEWHNFDERAISELDSPFGINFIVSSMFDSKDKHFCKIRDTVLARFCEEFLKNYRRLNND